MGFIKKNCTSCRANYRKVEFYGVGRGFAGPQGAGMGWENFPHHAGRDGDGTRQYHTGRGRRTHPSASPRPLAIPKRVEFEVKTQGRDIF